MSSYKSLVPNPLKEVTPQLRDFRVPDFASRDSRALTSKKNLAQKIGIKPSELNERMLLAHAVGEEDDLDRIKQHGANMWSYKDDNDATKWLVRYPAADGHRYMGNFKPIGIATGEPTTQSLVDFHTTHTISSPTWRGSRTQAFSDWCGSIKDLSLVRNNATPSSDKDRDGFMRLLGPYCSGTARCAARDAADPKLMNDPELRHQNYKQTQVAVQQWREHGHQGNSAFYLRETERIVDSLAVLNDDPNPLRPPGYQQDGGVVASYRDELASEVISYGETRFRDAADFRDGVLLLNCTSIYNEATKAGVERSMPTTYPGEPLPIDDAFAKTVGPWPAGDEKALAYKRKFDLPYKMHVANTTYGKQSKFLSERVYVLDKVVDGKSAGNVMISKDQYDKFRMAYGPTVNIEDGGKPVQARYSHYDQQEKEYNYKVVGGEGVKGAYNLKVDRDTHREFIEANPERCSNNRRGVITDKINNFFSPKTMPAQFEASIASADEFREIAREVRGLIEPQYAESLAKFTDDKLSPEQQQKVMEEEMEKLFKSLAPTEAVTPKALEDVARLQKKLLGTIGETVAKEFDEMTFTRFHEELSVAQKNEEHPLHAVWTAEDPKSRLYEDAKFLLDGFVGALNPRYHKAFATDAKYDILKKELPEGSDLTRRAALADRYYARQGYEGVIPNEHKEFLGLPEKMANPREEYISAMQQYVIGELTAELNFVAQAVKGSELPEAKSWKDLSNSLKPEHIMVLAGFRTERALMNFDMHKKDVPYVSHMRGDAKKNIAPLTFSRVGRKTLAPLERNAYMSEEAWSKIDDATKVRVDEHVKMTGSGLNEKERVLLSYLEMCKEDATELEKAYGAPPLEMLLSGLRTQAGQPVTDPIEKEVFDEHGSIIMERVASFDSAACRKILQAFEEPTVAKEQGIDR